MALIFGINVKYNNPFSIRPIFYSYNDSGVLVGSYFPQDGMQDKISYYSIGLTAWLHWLEKHTDIPGVGLLILSRRFTSSDSISPIGRFKYYQQLFRCSDATITELLLVSAKDNLRRLG